MGNIKMSDHLPIFLEVGTSGENLGAPFKYNVGLFKEDNLQLISKENWRHIKADSDDSVGHQFAQSLKIVK